VSRPPILVFDLDDTLAPSKAPLPDAAVDLLTRLLGTYDVCVISGARFGQFEQQVVDRLPPEADLRRLHLMPTCGAAYYRWDDGWVQVYADHLTTDEISRAFSAIEGCARALGSWEPHTWGERIQDRGAQVTFSALGQEAPLAPKRAWDPDGAKKERLRACIQSKLPDLEVRSGGSTSVDVTRRGIDKAYGVRRLMQQLSRGADEVVFFGDRLDPGGNDYPVIGLGVRCIPVSDDVDTIGVVEAFEAALAVAD
jgi:HAD superfamily hydrolase (TIGR01484 family)